MQGLWYELNIPNCRLCQARGLSQKVLAEVLHVQQPSIAKMERRTDMYISTLRSHIEAMGGQLEVIARFPDGSVKICGFHEHPATDSTLIRPPVSRASGHLLGRQQRRISSLPSASFSKQRGRRGAFIHA